MSAYKAKAINLLVIFAIATMMMLGNTLTILKDSGYAILEAEDGETAVRKLVEYRDTARLLLKPVSPEALLKKVTEVLDK